MSTNIFNRDDGNKCLSYQQIDQDFDNYWETEARNPVRNRIRIGRQYQATIQPMLRTNEIDKREQEKRETLKWQPQNTLNEQQLDQYLQLAKAVSMFAKVITENEKSSHRSSSSITKNNCTSKCSNETCDHRPANDQSHVTKMNEKDYNSSNKTHDHISTRHDEDEITNKMKQILSGLSQFVDAHHPLQAGDANCKLVIRNKTQCTSEDEHNKTTNDKNCDDDELIESDISSSSNWTISECALFAAALQACGKNFSAIKKEFLPWKSSKIIMDYYQHCLQQSEKNTNDNFSNQMTSTISRSCSNQQDASCDEKSAKFHELRHKLDARSNSDTKLKQCSSDMNQILLDLIKANALNNSIEPEVNKKSSSNINDNVNEDVNSDKIELRTSYCSSTKNTAIDDKKEQMNVKKKSKFKFTDRRILTFKSSSNKTTETSEVARTSQKTTPDPIDQYEFDDKLEPTNSLGSLKFYKDGQLVLKLNAKQPSDNNDKCKWEESADSIEMNKFRRNYKKKRSNRAKDTVEQLESGKSRVMNEEHDDSSSESDDSRSSSSSSFQKALNMNNMYKKARVKVENNYFVPLASPSTKDDLEKEIEQTGRKSLSPLNQEENLKRKSRTTRNSSAKKKVLKLNECTNKLNISSTNLIRQLNGLSPSNASSTNPVLDQLNLLSSLPLDLRQKLLLSGSASASSPTKQAASRASDSGLMTNSSNSINCSNSNDVQNILNLALRDSLMPNMFHQQNNDSLNQLLSSLVQMQTPNTFHENIDSIKMQNQLQNLMSNLSALIESDQLK